MSVVIEKVVITNETSLNALFVDVVDFLREQAEGGKIFEVFTVADLFNKERYVSLREIV